MRVVVLTTKEELYHRYLCTELALNNDVVAVLHPERRSLSRQERLRLARSRIKRRGVGEFLVRTMMSRGSLLGGWNEQQDLADAYRRFLGTAAADYEKHVSGRAHDVPDINSAEGVALLASFKPDVVVCSGGPIYRTPVIEASGLMLNFHTGISPIYNGNMTIYWTFANRQPHLTGGTMMRMSPVVDGGDILAHYFPSVESGDTPAAQFVKTIMGGARLYNRFLDNLSRGQPFVALPQGKPFRYYYGQEWTPVQSLAVQRYVREDLCKDYQRPERIHEYWSYGEPAEAAQALKSTLLKMVYDQ